MGFAVGDDPGNDVLIRQVENQELVRMKASAYAVSTGEFSTTAKCGHDFVCARQILDAIADLRMGLDRPNREEHAEGSNAVGSAVTQRLE